MGSIFKTNSSIDMISAYSALLTASWLAASVLGANEDWPDHISRGGKAINVIPWGWGSYGSWKYAKYGYYACGFKTRIEGDQGGGDDTGLNGVKLMTCNGKYWKDT